jgi:hypothetical protein
MRIFAVRTGFDYCILIFATRIWGSTWSRHSLGGTEDLTPSSFFIVMRCLKYFSESLSEVKLSAFDSLVLVALLRRV